jgi:ubiquinone/menaquinone biosynthesis C-methylase UbiE
MATTTSSIARAVAPPRPPPRTRPRTVASATNARANDEDHVVVIDRRRALMMAFAGCACASCAAPNAQAMVKLIESDAAASMTYDVARDAGLDATFARGMATMMSGFESAVKERKRALFETLFATMRDTGRDELAMCEIGAGTLPNIDFIASMAPRAVDLIAIDPNDAMRAFAEDNLAAALAASDNEVNVRFVHGVAEALPLPDNSMDAVVSTLTLCSVVDQRVALKEIRRVLKPGGALLFLEHVLSETDPKFAELQEKLTPLQIKAADGCHLNRRTLDVIRDEFSAVDGEYYELDGFWVISPQVSGIAVA